MYNRDRLRFCRRAVRAGLGTDHLHLLGPDLQLATQRLGSDNGGWIIAVEPLSKVTSPVVLSFGLGDDISFDEEITARYRACVHGFDPTSESLNWINARGKPANMKVYPIGIGTFDGRQGFLLPKSDSQGIFSATAAATASRHVICDVMRYDSIVALLQLQHVDVLTLDVEGSDHDVISDILASSVLPAQLLIELDHRLHHIHASETLTMVNMIKQSGFSLFAVSQGGDELSFIRH
jgi:hypothetical protein